MVHSSLLLRRGLRPRPGHQVNDQHRQREGDDQRHQREEWRHRHQQRRTTSTWKIPRWSGYYKPTYSRHLQSPARSRATASPTTTIPYPLSPQGRSRSPPRSPLTTPRSSLRDQSARRSTSRSLSIKRLHHEVQNLSCQTSLHKWWSKPERNDASSSSGPRRQPSAGQEQGAGSGLSTGTGRRCRCLQTPI